MRESWTALKQLLPAFSRSAGKVANLLSALGLLAVAWGVITDNLWLLGFGIGLEGVVLAVNRQLEIDRLAAPKLDIECGNILGQHLLRWYGPGAEEHPPILLLRIHNRSPANPIDRCRVQVWFDPWDEQRFDPLPRDLPWWRGYDQYSSGERPLETSLAPGGSGAVVLVDDSDTALKLRPFDVDEDLNEYVLARVIAWGDAPGRTERSFRIVWDAAALTPLVISATDGSSCVEYEVPPSVFLPTAEDT